MESVTASEFIEGDVAMWMGWVMLTDKNGQSDQGGQVVGLQERR